MGKCKKYNNLMILLFVVVSTVFAIDFNEFWQFSTLSESKKVAEDLFLWITCTSRQNENVKYSDLMILEHKNNNDDSATFCWKINAIAPHLFGKLMEKADLIAIPFFQYCSFDDKFLSLWNDFCEEKNVKIFKKMLLKFIFLYYDFDYLQASTQAISILNFLPFEEENENSPVNSIQAGIGAISILCSIGFKPIEEELSSIDENLCEFFRCLFRNIRDEFPVQMTSITSNSSWMKLFFYFLKQFLQQEVFDEDENYLFEGLWRLKVSNFSCNASDEEQIQHEKLDFSLQFADALMEFDLIFPKYRKALSKIPKLEPNGKDIVLIEKIECAICFEPIRKRTVVFKAEKSNAPEIQDFSDWCSYSKLHCFHRRCIFEWINSSQERNCPICRQKLERIH